MAFSKKTIKYKGCSDHLKGHVNMYDNLEGKSRDVFGISMAP